MTSVIRTYLLPLRISPPAPTTFLPAGQLAVTALFAELLPLVTVTRVLPVSAAAGAAARATAPPVRSVVVRGAPVSGRPRLRALRRIVLVGEVRKESSLPEVH